MTAKKYIYNKLQFLANLFPALTFKYEHRENYKTHVIEVKPESEFEGNNDYIDFELEFSSEFNETYFPESVLFISENSLTQISNPEKVFKSNNFINEYSINPKFQIESDEDIYYPQNSDEEFAIAA
jgi:hypothetical protein